MIPRFQPWLGWPEFLALFRKNKNAVEQFETAFAKEFDAKEAISFSYGRAALWAFLNAVGVKDAEVIMPAYTCSVVAHAITLSGNHPKFIDINLSNYNMNLDLLSELIGPKTRAVVATHLFGYALDLDRLESIVTTAEQQYQHKIWLIQDCAHSFGATWKGRSVAQSGDVALYGLNISKMMTSIFGGMLTFQDPQLAQQVRKWRNTHFKKASYFKPLYRRAYLLTIYVAFSRWIYTLTYWISEKTPLIFRFTKAYHLDEEIHFPPDYLDLMLNVEAAVGLEQLKKYKTIITRRRRNAALYSKNLTQLANITYPPLQEGATYSHFVLRVPDRASYLKKMAKRGIQLGELIQYSVPNLSFYNKGQECANADYASHSTINLPIGPTVVNRQIRKIFSTMNYLK